MEDDSKKQAYREKAEAELREWNAKIDELLAKAGQAKAEGKIELQERAEDLKAKRDVVAGRVEELRDASEENWKDLRERLEEARDELRNGIEQAFSALQSG